MRVFFCIIFSLFFLLNINSLELTPFSNSGEDISFQYPKNWFIKELIYNYPYYIFVSDIELKKSDDIFKTGITITKFYHQSWQFNFDQDMDKAIEKIKSNVKTAISENKDHKILSEETVTINDLKFLKVVYVFNDGSDNLTIINYFTVNKDSYLWVTLEAPTDKIPEYNDYFNNFISKSVFFTNEKTDNHIVDTPSLNISSDIIKLEPGDKDMEKYLDSLTNAIKMNPHFPFLYLASGIFYFKLCKNLKGEKQKDLAKITIEHFDKSAENFIKYKSYLIEEKLGNEKSLNSYITQCYYSMAEIYKYVFSDKDKAKNYYEKALEFTESKQIRDSLNKL